MTLPSFHHPHASGPMQQTRGDVGLKSSAAARPRRFFRSEEKFFFIQRYQMQKKGLIAWQDDQCVLGAS